MNQNDNRISILSQAGYQYDPRINFICLDYPDLLEHIDSFDGSSEEKLDECMEQFVSEIINAKVNIDTDQGEISLPKVLEIYKADFGGTDDSILQFVFRYLEEEYDYESILNQVSNKSILIKYEWTKRTNYY